MQTNVSNQDVSNRDVSSREHAFRIIETEWIALADGTRVAARIWLPESAEPVPAILEYLPYRRRDGTRLRDEITFPFLARHGYAGVRVDIRGNGDSEGLMEDEYTAQELNDGVEVIDWIARQDWCSGAVGMLGISWGGFNGLQIAALAPTALKAIVSVCSTDDRYADDMHYKGGCLLNDNMTWSQQMLAYSSRPPDPAVVGARWKEMWLERLERTPLFATNWLQHQRRDAFWKHASVCEDLGAIKAAVMIVGGWADSYTDAVFRLLDGLNVPRRAIIGAWEHAYPNIAKIEPRIDFLGESVKWWDRWLKPDGDTDAPTQLTVFIEDAALPNTHYADRRGCWKTFSEPLSRMTHAEMFYLNIDGLGSMAGNTEWLDIASAQDTGASAGELCPGMRVRAGLPDDQRADDAKSLVFEMSPLTEDIIILGAPVLDLELMSDKPCAFIAARLCEVAPDGAATLISWGVLNLTHRHSHENATPIEVGKTFAAQVELNNVARKIPRGHHLRISLSNAYWPMIWPSPEKNTLKLATASSRLTLPMLRSDATFDNDEFAPPPKTTPPERDMRRQPAYTHNAQRIDGALVLETFDDFGSCYNPAFNLETGSSVAQRFVIHPDAPLSAEASAEWEQTLLRNDWNIRTRSWTAMSADATHFHLKAGLVAYESGKEIFRRDWDETIKRDLV